MEEVMFEVVLKEKYDFDSEVGDSEWKPPCGKDFGTVDKRRKLGQGKKKWWVTGLGGGNRGDTHGEQGWGGVRGGRLGGCPTVIGSLRVP